MEADKIIERKQHGHKAPFRVEYSLTELGEKLYAIGGEDGDDAGNGLECEVYDPYEDKWTDVPGPGLTRTRHQAIAFGSRLIVIGGMEGERETVLRSCWSLNVTTHEWSQLSDMPSPRADFTAFVYNDNIFVR